MLKKEDKMFLFAAPVTEQMAPTYHDVIKKPMDLETMEKKLKTQSHKNYAWIREDFELMVLNALTFNRFYSAFWNEAKRYYWECVKSVFTPYGKGAPPGEYKELVDECFLKAAKHKRMEEQRIQQDTTAEKKDLVAGATVAKISLPPRQDPPDQPSCVPFTEVKLKPVEAHYCSWMESCFTCGSSGAPDTMLFCVDCGEAFHSFCVNAPIHSMEQASVSGWRCPNCKICEISAEVPKDELKMLYCDMCDRAVSLDLLEPPLSKAPQGLWICGQCVNCSECDKDREMNGVSLKYWSRVHDKCYRCGGCDGLVDHITKSMRCGVCSKIYRSDDTDLAECQTCHKKVHGGCDRLAQRALSGDNPNVRYDCPSCRKDRTEAIPLDGKKIRKQLQKEAWGSVVSGSLPLHPGTSSREVHEKLCDEIDWSTRDLFRNEYIEVIRTALTMIAAVKRQNIDWFVVLDAALNGKWGLPLWVCQRAARFFHLTKHSKKRLKHLTTKSIKSLVVLSRMAAALIRVARNCTAAPSQRMAPILENLIAAPDSFTCGLIDDHVDLMKIVEIEETIIDAVEGAYQEFTDTTNSKKSYRKLSADNDVRRKVDKVDYIIPEPLRGWQKFLKNDNASTNDSEDSKGTATSKAVMEWKDPRTCCLCRTCGDDDADNESAYYEDGQPPVARMGRLLPMPDSLWVHASCALWSSEVYEAATGGLIHSMDKARSRSTQLKCFGCGRNGASLGCSKPNCSKNYHFPCAKACGAVFTKQKQMFCADHVSCATSVVDSESGELMKTLKIAPDRKLTADKIAAMDTAAGACSRVGCLVVHSYGEINQSKDGFHSEKHIMPRGYTATRIFWSTKEPKSRTVYILKIEEDTEGGNGPVFSITAADDPTGTIRERKADAAYRELIARVRKTNAAYYSGGNLLSKLPVKRKSSKKTYGLNGSQVSGPFVARRLDTHVT